MQLAAPSIAQRPLYEPDLAGAVRGVRAALDEGDVPDRELADFPEEFWEGVRELASAGSPRANLLAGIWLISQQGNFHALKRGAEALRRAAEAGQCEAMTVLASYLWRHYRHVPEDHAMAVDLYSRAAGLGCGVAMSFMSLRAAVAGDRDAALGWARRAAQTAYHDGGWLHGVTALEYGHQDEGIAALRGAAQRGSSRAAYRLAVELSRDGRGEQTAREWPQWLNWTAGRGHVPAMAWLGGLLVQGARLPADLTRGFALLQAASDSGNLAATEVLVDVLFLCPEEDSDRIVRVLRQGEVLGSAWCKGALGAWLLDTVADRRVRAVYGEPMEFAGRPDKALIREAAELLEDAAESNAFWALSLGAMLANGAVLPRDVKAARKWFERALDSGEDGAAFLLTRLAQGKLCVLEAHESDLGSFADLQVEPELEYPQFECTVPAMERPVFVG